MKILSKENTTAKGITGNRIRLLLLSFLLLIAGAAFPFSTTDVYAGEIGELDQAPRSFLSETPFTSQCDLGSAVSDAVNSACGSDFAFVESSLLKNDINQGVVTKDDITNVFQQDEKLVVVPMSPYEMKQLLEQAVSQIQVDPSTEKIVREKSEDGESLFCQVSGFRFCYDASAPAGQRVHWIEKADEDHTRLDLDDNTSSYKVVMAESLYQSAGEGIIQENGGDPAAAEETGETLVSALSTYVAQNTVLPQGDTERSMVVGARRNTIAGVVSRPMLGLFAFILLVVLGVSRVRRRRLKEIMPDLYDSVSEKEFRFMK